MRRHNQPPPPFHLFGYKGREFVFDTSSARFYGIDGLTRRFLNLSLDPSIESIEQVGSKLEADECVTSEQISFVTEGVRTMTAQGLLQSPSYTITPGDAEHQLRQRYQVPWTGIELALSEACNLACKYCYCDAGPDLPKQGVMGVETAKRSLDLLFSMSRNSKEVHVTLFGGEPLLNKRVFRFVMKYSQKLAKETEKTVRYTLTTNGTLLDDEVIHYIKRFNFGLMVSLDGPPAVQNNQRPTSNGLPSYDDAVTGIRRLMQRRRTVTVRCTMTKAGTRMIDLIRFFEEFGFTRIILGRAINPTDPTPVDCDRETLENYMRQEEEEILPWILERLALGEQPKYFPYGSLIAKLHRPAAERVPLRVANCGACRGTTTVGADGKLYPCHRYVGMSAFVLGHIDDGMSVAASKQYWRDFNQAMGKCDRCWARLLCERPCAWEVSNTDGTFHEPEEWKCDMIRSYFERGAFIYSLLLSDFPDMLERIVPVQQPPPKPAPPNSGRRFSNSPVASIGQADNEGDRNQK